MDIKPVARLRSNLEKIESWEDVDTALGVIRLLDARVDRLAVECDTEVQRLQEAKKRRTEPLSSRKKAVEALVETWVNAHRDGWKKRSVKMTHGEVGFRWKSPAVEYIEGEADAMRKLKARNQLQCIVTKEEISKDELKKLSDSERRSCGVRLVQEEVFYYKLNKDAVAEYPEIQEGEPE